MKGLGSAGSGTFLAELAVFRTSTCAAKMMHALRFLRTRLSACYEWFVLRAMVFNFWGKENLNFMLNRKPCYLRIFISYIQL